MNKQLRDEWVRALRSGEYKQTSYKLQRADAYCCLGVLCEVADKIGFAVPRRITIDGIPHIDGAALTWQPQSLQREVSPFQDHVMAMNDGGGGDFPAIADWIEANVPVDEVTP